MKKRTTAQRRKAARAGWEKRRLKMANKPSGNGNGLPEAAEVWVTPRVSCIKFLKEHEALHEVHGAQDQRRRLRARR